VGGAFVSINITCLDDVEESEFVSFKVRTCDGRNNEWWNEPEHGSYL